MNIMTATENLCLNSEALTHSIDFGLKRKFGNSWWLPNERIYKAQIIPEMIGYHYFNKPRRLSQSEKTQQRWVGITAEQRPMSSPMTVTTETSYNEDTPTDQAAANRLYALDNILARQPRSFSPPVFDTFYLQKSPSKDDDSDYSREVPSPVSQSLLAVAKSLSDAQQQQGVTVGKSRQFFESSHANNNYELFTLNKNTRSSPIPDRSKFCKRKGGWKFHDLSEEDSIGRKKRAYGQNKLENVILQLYQDRITIKNMPGMNSNKASDRITVIEPSNISDPDLVKYNTSLRLILDKKNGSYQLQILPFTLQRGSLCDKTEVLVAVSKMLGENGAVLCPGIVQAQTSSYDSNTSQNSSLPLADRPGLGLGSKDPKYKDSSENNRRKFVPFSNGNGNGRWAVFSCSSDKANYKSMEANSAVFKTSSNTDKLLEDLNSELTKTNQQTKQHPQSLQNDSRCLLWHVPVLGEKRRRANWPEEAKWCRNCVRKFQLLQAGTLDEE